MHLRHLQFAIILYGAIAVLAGRTAHADDWSGGVALSSSWFDDEQSNRVLSEEPGLEWEVTYQTDSPFYLEAAGRVGFDGVSGPSSEIDVGAGVQFANVSLYLGRQQYGSEEDGFSSGEWIGRADLELGRLTLSAIALWGGEEDTERQIYRGEVNISPWESTPIALSVAYTTGEEDQWNPGIRISHAFDETFSVEALVARNYDEDTGEADGYYAGVRLRWAR